LRYARRRRLQAASRSHPEKPNLHKLDKARIYGQILSFTRTNGRLDEQPTEAF
jgi:hypothetical protein